MTKNIFAVLGIFVDHVFTNCRGTIICFMVSLSIALRVKGVRLCLGDDIHENQLIPTLISSNKPKLTCFRSFVWKQNQWTKPQILKTNSNCPMIKFQCPFLPVLFLYNPTYCGMSNIPVPRPAVDYDVGSFWPPLHCELLTSVFCSCPISPHSSFIFCTCCCFTYFYRWNGTCPLVWYSRSLSAELWFRCPEFPCCTFCLVSIWFSVFPDCFSQSASCDVANKLLSSVSCSLLFFFSGHRLVYCPNFCLSLPLQKRSVHSTLYSAVSSRISMVMDWNWHFKKRLKTWIMLC